MKKFKCIYVALYWVRDIFHLLNLREKKKTDQKKNASKTDDWEFGEDENNEFVVKKQTNKKKPYLFLESTFIFVSLEFSEVQTHLILMQNAGQDSEGSNAENINQKWVY